MNRTTRTALIALIASIAFIGMKASAEEPPAPEIKSWLQLAEERSNYDPIACYAMEHSARVCRPKLEDDGSYGEECQEMRVECGVLIPEGDYMLVPHDYGEPFVAEISPYTDDYEPLTDEELAAIWE